MKYLVLLLVLLGFTGTAFGQYMGDKLPPNTMVESETGKYVLPPSYVDFYYSNSKFEKYSVIADSYRYVIPYIIPNGTVSKISIDCNNAILVLDVSTTVNQEWLTLALPRQLIDSKLGLQGDDTFMVLVDSTEIKYSDIASEKLRIVNIPISNDTSSVKIIGVNYPEHMGENTCHGKHDPPFAYLLSPLKQFKSGIPSQQVLCNEGLDLVMKKSNGHPICVKPATKSKLLQNKVVELAIITEEGFVISQGHMLKPILTVEGLSKTYSVGQKIEFTIKFDGVWNNCGVPRLKIEDANHQQVWEGGLVVSLCDPDLKKEHIKKEWIVNDDSNLGVPVIYKEGFYTLFVTYGDAIIQKDIAIIHENEN